MVEALVERLASFETVEGYRRWIKGMYGFYGSMERALHGLAAPRLFESRHFEARLARLALDIDDLCLERPFLPGTPVLSLTDFVDELGVLYVTEGAALGARVLVDQVASLGFTGNFGARHLTAEARSHPAWTTVCGHLKTVRFDDEATSRLIHVALRAFDLAAHNLENAQ
jgi:heme oxygenase